MLKFILEGKLCLVEGPHEEKKVLRNCLSFFDKGAFHRWEYKSGIWDGMICLYDDENQSFLGGMWNYAISKLKTLGVEVEVEDKRTFPAISSEVDSGIIPNITLYDYQISAIKKALLKKGGIIQIPPGGGKTNIAAALLLILKRPALFLVEKRRLLRQTVKRFRQYGLKDVGKIGDDVFEPGFTTVATIQTLNSRLKKGDPEIRELLSSCEVLILDECHHASAASWQLVVMSCDAPFRFGLSGTPFRTRQLERYEDFLLLGICGNPCYILPTSYLIERGYLAKPHLYMLPVKSQSIQKLQKWIDVEKKGLVDNSVRNNLATRVIKNFVSRGLRTVVMVRMIEHGLNIIKLLELEGISAEFLCGDDVVYLQDNGSTSQVEDTVTGDDDSTTIQEFVARKFQVLVVSTVLDEGIDVPEIEALVILSGGKSLIKTIQRLGRGLRQKENDNTIPVVDFWDEHHSWLRTHSKFRSDQFKLEGHEVWGLSEFVEHFAK